jgi:hypothetical protein
MTCGRSLDPGGAVSAMKIPVSAPPSVSQVRTLFPDRSSEVARRALRDEGFRFLCKNYSLALETYNLLLRRNLPGDALKVPEYRTLLSKLQMQLERELRSDPAQ